MKKISQKTIYRIVALLAVCVFLLANLCAGKLTAYHRLSLDFTGTRLYALSDATKNALSEIKSQTTIYVISDRAAYSRVLSEILDRYAKLTPAIGIRYIDPYADYVFMDRYGGQGFQLADSDILVEGIHGTRHIPLAEIFTRDNNGNPRGLTLEEKLTNALVYANTGRELRAAFTAGHGEETASPLEEALSGGGFSTEPLTLITGAVPSSDIVVAAGPERDFLIEEIAALESYLDNGGALMVFTEPGAQRLPNLEKLLSAWGLSLLPGVVSEPRAHSPGNQTSIIPLYGMHEVNISFAERQYYLALPGARALSVAEDTPGVAVTRLLLSTRDAYAKNEMNGSLAKSADDLSGPFVLAALAKRQDTKSGVLLFGSTGIYDPGIIASPAFANREYLVSAALALAETDTRQAVSIPAKTLAAPPINAQFTTTLVILLIFGIFLPLAALIAGAVILYRRRRK